VPWAPQASIVSHPSAWLLSSAMVRAAGSDSHGASTRSRCFWLLPRSQHHNTEDQHGHRNRQMVQSGQGVRLHHPPMTARTTSSSITRPSTRAAIGTFAKAPRSPTRPRSGRRDRGPQT
jgi:hypothetical protein